MLREWRALHVLRKPPVAPPMIGHSAATMRDDEFQGRKITKQFRCKKLHKCTGIGIDIVGSGGVKARIARRADVYHRRYIEVDYLLIERVPPAIGQRGISPIAPRWIRIEIAANESKLGHATLEFLPTPPWLHPRALRQLADPHEVARVQSADPVNKIVADPRPFSAGLCGANVVGHS